MTNFYDADDFAESHLEVSIQLDVLEKIYWVLLENCPEDEDTYDWAIEKAVDYFLKNDYSGKSEKASVLEFAEAYEPFSRSESEFTFL